MSGKPSLWRAFTIVFTKAGVHAVIIYRLSNFLNRNSFRFFGELTCRLNYFLTGAEIDCQAEIGSGFRLPHPTGVVIGRGVKIGKNVSILHQVTLGGNGAGIIGFPGPDGYPTIEDNVWIFTGAKVLGPITVGQNSCILADALVTENVPPNSIAGDNFIKDKAA
jgi:serine O-acetyltransferase